VRVLEEIDDGGRDEAGSDPGEHDQPGATHRRTIFG
jgi:hypothetical protein